MKGKSAIISSQDVLLLAYFLYLFVCLCIIPIVAWQRLRKNPLIVARQRLSRNVTAVTNTHARIQKLLDTLFSMWPVSYEGI
jgi:hypothetical protein